MGESICMAALSGDLIGSSALSSEELQSAREALEEAVERIDRWKPGLVAGGVEFFRGDAWQLALTDAAWALRAGVFVRAVLRASETADTRVSIGIGAVDKLEPQRVSLSLGEAFSLSGHALDQMTVYSDMTVALPRSAGPLVVWLPVVTGLCSALIGRWTPRQCQMICEALDPAEPNLEEVGRRVRRPVKKQTAARALLSAGWRPVKEAITAFELTPWSSLARTVHDA